MTRKIKVEKYGNRFWAVWCDDELIVVAVYKKGANRVAILLKELFKSLGE